jgi:hypothetical protein
VKFENINVISIVNKDRITGFECFRVFGMNIFRNIFYYLSMFLCIYLYYMKLLTSYVSNSLSIYLSIGTATGVNSPPLDSCLDHLIK